MHRQLLEHLREAEGESKFVVATNVDIRGFSSFFADSSQAAAFLSYAYTRVLDNYFPNHDFFKPTGDGLLLVQTVNRESIPEVVREVVQSALRLDTDFASICDDDALINYPTPERVGIGISRGTATRLSGGGRTLDYSGYPLNLASRLMDLARPRGVVFDEAMLAGIDDDYDEFESSSVYIRGIAESAPLRIRHTSGISIPLVNRKPIGSMPHRQKAEKITVKQVNDRAPRFVHTLEREPYSTDACVLHFEYPAADSRGNKMAGGLHHASKLDASDVRINSNGRWEALFNYAEIVNVLTRGKAKSTWGVTIRLTYPVAMESPAEVRADGAEAAE